MNYLVNLLLLCATIDPSLCSRKAILAIDRRHLNEELLTGNPPYLFTRALPLSSILFCFFHHISLRPSRAACEKTGGVHLYFRHKLVSCDVDKGECVFSS